MKLWSLKNAEDSVSLFGKSFEQLLKKQDGVFVINTYMPI